MTHLAIPKRFHQHFVLLQYLASGQCGAVYKAQYRDGTLAAIKVFDKQHDRTVLGYFTNEQLLLRVINEHQQHPHIVTYIDSNLVRPPYFLATRFVEGARELQVMLGQPLPAGFVMRVVTQTASALDYLHHGHSEYSPIIHRDIKPTNLLINAAGDVVLIDLSIARHSSYAIMDEPGLGTVPYMAPEQYAGNEQPATDQFALAVVTLQMLTGRTLLPNNVKKAQQKLDILRSTQCLEVRQLLKARPQTAEVLCKALAFEPADRFASCGEFADRLRAALMADGEDLTHVAAPPEKRAHAVLAHVAMLATGIFAVVMLVLSLLNLAQTNGVVEAVEAPTTPIVTSTSISAAATFRWQLDNGPAAIIPTTALVDVPTAVVAAQPSVSSLPRVTAVGKTQPRMIHVVASTNEPLRATPSTNARILMRMPQGSNAIQTGREQKQRLFTWYEVVYQGRTGWCRSLYCKQLAGARE